MHLVKTCSDPMKRWLAPVEIGGERKWSSSLGKMVRRCYQISKSGFHGVTIETPLRPANLRVLVEIQVRFDVGENAHSVSVSKLIETINAHVLHGHSEGKQPWPTERAARKTVAKQPIANFRQTTYQGKRRVVSAQWTVRRCSSPWPVSGVWYQRLLRFYTAPTYRSRTEFYRVSDNGGPPGWGKHFPFHLFTDIQCLTIF